MRSFKVGVLALILISFYHVECGNITTRYNRDDKKKCIPKIVIETCKEGKNIRFIYLQHYEMSKIEPGCEGNKIISNNWKLLSKDGGKHLNLRQFRNKRTIAFNARTIPAGLYTFGLRAIETGGGIGLTTHQMEFETEPPVIVFVGPRFRSVKPNSKVVVDITPTVYYGKRNLIYKWTWTCTEPKKIEGCENPRPCKTPPGLEGKKFTIHHDHCYERMSMHVEVEFKSIIRKTVQHLIGKEEPFIGVHVLCKKNCDSAGNVYSIVSLVIQFSLECYENCKDFPNYRPKWSLETSDKKKVPSSAYTLSKDGLDFTIQPNTIQRASRYTIVVKSPVYECEGYITTEPNLKPVECTVTPTEGKTLQTPFHFECKNPNQRVKYLPHIYKVFELYPNKDYVHKESAESTFTLKLAGTDRVELQVTAFDIYFCETKSNIMTIKILPPELNTATASQIYSDLKAAESRGDHPEQLQLLTGLARTIEQGKLSEKEIKSYKLQLIDDLLRLPVSDYNVHKQVASMVQIFTKSLDKDTASKVGQLCTQLTKVMDENLQRHKSTNLQMQTAFIKKEVEMIHNCGDAVMTFEENAGDEDEEEEKDEKEYSYTEEDAYKDYDEEETNEDIASDLKKEGKSIIRAAALAMSETLATQENFTYEANNSKLFVVRTKAADLHKKKIGIGNVAVTAGDDFKKLGNQIVTSMVIEYKARTFEGNKTVVATNIAEVNFYKGATKEKMKGYKVDLSFDVLNFEHNYSEHKLSVPRNYRRWEVPKINYDMNVHRMNLLKHHSACMRFANETPPLKVVLAINDRPDIAKFRGAKSRSFRVYGNNNIISFPKRYNKLDRFLYLAVLPDERELKRSKHKIYNTSYELTMTNVLCVVLSDDIGTWKTAGCDTSTYLEGDKQKVRCRCKHASVYAGKIFPANSRLDTVAHVTIKVDRFTNYTIFINISTIMVCYCIALCFFHYRSSTYYGRNKVIYLSDNQKNDRYAYLLVIKTGNYMRSGTSSNCCIRIYGSKAMSRPHVINYPDPDKFLLQRDSTDWYIVSTPQHLGTITHIRLWFDGVGLRPAWYCDSITIMDLQEKVEYQFFIDKWFSVAIKKAVTEVMVMPNEEINMRQSVIVNLQKNVRFYWNAEHTWNIFLKIEDDTFPYNQRITVILSIILTTYVITSWVLNPPQMKGSDAFGLGAFQFSARLIVLPTLVSLASSAMHLPLVYFFRNSEQNFDKTALLKHEKKYSVKVTKVCWIILIVWTVVCLVYLITLGFWVPFITSYYWILCCTISLLISIFIVENIYVICYNVLRQHYRKIPRTYYYVKGILQEAENQRKNLFEYFGEVLFRPYFKNHYHPLSYIEKYEMKQKEKTRLETQSLVTEMCIFIMYITTLYIITLINLDSERNQSTEHIRFMTENGTHNKYYTLSQINSIDDIYKYINKTLVKVIHPQSWYPGFENFTRGFMSDYTTKVLGVVQLRQQRREQKCAVPYQLRGGRFMCYNDESTFEKWSYTNGEGISHESGILEYYGGAGYITYLGRKLKKALFVVNVLKRMKWIDINTKVLFIEFWTYNADYNIFNMVRVTIERSRTGRIIPRSNVFTARLIFANPSTRAIQIVLFSVFIGLICVMITRRSLKAFFTGMSYFKNFWNLWDIVLLILSVTIIIIHFTKQRLLATLLSELSDSNLNQFVFYFKLARMMETEDIIRAITLCMATVKLWKYLRFTTMFRIMERILIKSYFSLLLICVYQAFLFTNYATHLYLVYGSNNLAFRTQDQTLMMLYMTSMNWLRKRNLNYLEFRKEGVFFYGFYASFMVISVFFNQVYSTIIITAYKESKIYFSNQPILYSIKTYIYNEIVYCNEKRRRQNLHLRIAGGGTGKDPSEVVHVYPKDDIVRYGECAGFTDRDLLIMRLISICTILKLRKGLKSYQEQKLLVNMARLYIALLNPKRKMFFPIKRKVLFFRGRDPNTHEIKFVSDYRLRQMEWVVKKLLEHPEDYESSSDEDIMDPKLLMHSNDTANRIEKMTEAIDYITDLIKNIQFARKK